MLAELFPGTSSLHIQSDKDVQTCMIRHYRQWVHFVSIFAALPHWGGPGTRNSRD
jgi:hypothetical protein